MFLPIQDVTLGEDEESWQATGLHELASSKQVWAGKSPMRSRFYPGKQLQLRSHQPVPLEPMPRQLTH